MTTQAQKMSSWEIRKVIELLGLPAREVTPDIERSIIRLLKKNTIDLTADKIRPLLIARGFI